MTDHPIDRQLADLGVDLGALDPDVLDALRNAAQPTGTPVPLDRNHPVRYLLTEASFGRQPTSKTLDRLEAVSATLPEGHSLARFRSEIAKGAARVADIKATGDHATARQLADTLAGRIANKMTPDEAAVTSIDTDPEPLDDISARMFGGY